MTDKQYEELLTIATGYVAARCPVLAGVLEPGTTRSIERLKILNRVGAEAAVVVPPYYCRAHSEIQLLRHFELLRSATDLDLIFYNIPACTGVKVPVEFICELRRRNFVIACKDSSGDSEYFADLCRKGSECGLMVFQGMQPDFSVIAKLDAAGCVPVPGNVHPELFVKAWNNRFKPEVIFCLQQQCDDIWDELVNGYDFFSRSVALLAKNGIGSGVMPEPFSRFE